MSACKQIWFWRLDYGGVQANNQLPQKTALLKQVTDEGPPAPKQRSLRKSDHRGLQANNQLPKLSEVETAEDNNLLADKWLQ